MTRHAYTERHIDWTTSLFESCVLPGCSNPVVEAGQACASCVFAFGSLLRPVDGPARGREELAAEIACRDRDVRAHYDARRTAPAAPDADRPRRNQLCWICEERRTCTAEPAGWECTRCRSVTP